MLLELIAVILKDTEAETGDRILLLSMPHIPSFMWSHRQPNFLLPVENHKHILFLPAPLFESSWQPCLPLESLEWRGASLSGFVYANMCHCSSSVSKS